MMGFYPVCPGNPDYALVSPVFDKITIQLDPNYYSGNKLEIINHKANTTDYLIHKIMWNGQKYNSYFINHNTITKGGKLEFFLKK